MELTKLIERTELHDSSTVQMAREGEGVHLKFENVWVDDKNCYTVSITLGGVHDITCDDEVVNDLHMETEDGGVLAFKRSDTIAELFITWTSYKPRVDETRSYKFDYTTFDLHAEKQK